MALAANQAGSRCSALQDGPDVTLAVRLGLLYQAQLVAELKSCSAKSSMWWLKGFVAATGSVYLLDGDIPDGGRERGETSGWHGLKAVRRWTCPSGWATPKEPVFDSKD